LCPLKLQLYIFRVSGKPTGFKGCPFHRVIKDFMIQGGDIINGDGTGSISIYGEKFDDENFKLEHSSAGLLSSANSGPNTNGCQFFITCAPCDWLDNKHVVFGHVVEGMKFVRMAENVAVGAGSVPKMPVIISMCGQFS
jgi:peptidyl-prolyl isomerase H (cyclophilin H)